MKKILTSLIAVFSFVGVMAIPASPKPIVVEQPDGSQITIIKHGDEHFHYTTDAQGQWLKQDINGALVPTEALSLEAIETKRMQSSTMQWQMKRVKQQAQTEIPLNIAEKGLIILVNFKDKSFKSANTLAAMTQMMTGDTYTYNGGTGSARQYFYDQSMGKYNPQFDVVGPVTISQNYSYYGKNNSNNDDTNPDEMVEEACRLADSQLGVDFKQYDNNNDGIVDFVYIIYAGNGEADSYDENTIWPHASSVYYNNVKLDGVRLDTYACGPELNGYGNRNGIGTFCHEFSHVCGLPDLYATNYASHKTMGTWDILDAGPYNNNSNTPPAYSAYERFFCGWLTPTYINSAADLTLEELQASNKAYIITESKTPNLVGNDPNPTTFYLLENRQQKGWDKYIPGHGMMLTKIAYDYTKWTYNTVNNTASSMGVDLIEADGSAPSNNYGKAKDLFPAGAKSYTKIVNREITDITEVNGVINFKFMGGAEEPIEPTEIDFNYGQAIYLTDNYAQITEPLWEVDALNIVNSNNEYDAWLSTCITTVSGTSIAGTYNVEDTRWTSIEIPVNDTLKEIDIVSGTIEIKYVGQSSDGYPIYNYHVAGIGENNERYNLTYEGEFYCYDKKTEQQITMTDGSVVPVKTDVEFNWGQAANINGKYPQITDPIWQVDLLHLTDSNNNYDAWLSVGISSKSMTSIAGVYSISSTYWAQLQLTVDGATKEIQFTSGAIEIKYKGLSTQGYPIYNIHVVGITQDVQIYTINYEGEFYCFNSTTDAQITMIDDMSTGLDVVANADFVSIVDGSLQIDAQGDVQIYNVMGQLLYHQTLQGPTMIDDIRCGQVLIIRAGNKATKIVY